MSFIYWIAIWLGHSLSNALIINPISESRDFKVLVACLGLTYLIAFMSVEFILPVVEANWL